VLSQVAGVAALVCLAATVATLVSLHLVPTGLSPIRDAVSQYGISRYRAGYRVATITLGLAGVALVVGIAARVSAGAASATVALVVVFSVARLIISWYPMDAPGASRTSQGTAHGLIAVITFTSVTAAALRFGATLRRSAHLHELSPVSTGLGAAMAACLVVMLLMRTSPSARNYFGMVERMLYLAIIGWVGTLAAALAFAAR
jgi:hypothetical protein